MRERSSAAAPVDAAAPVGIIDAAAQERAIEAFSRENAAVRATARRVLATLDALVAAGLVALVLLHYRDPAGVHAELLAPLRAAASLPAVNAVLLGSAAAAAANAALLWRGARRWLPAAAGLALLPAGLAAALMSHHGLWPRWRLWWLPACAPGLTLLAWELERTLDRIDADIEALVKLRFDVKSA